MVENFKDRIKALRIERGLTQTQLAGMCGLRQTAIGNWETGTTIPSVHMIIKLADIFNVTADYLLGRRDY